MTIQLEREAVGAQVYARAERFLPWNAEKLVFGMQVEPNWLDAGDDRFWYRNSTRTGTVFVLVDPGRRTREAAFDHDRLAAALTAASGSTYTPDDLPLERLKFECERRVVEFSIMSQSDVRWQCDLETYTCRRADGPAEPAEGETESPDGVWVAFVRNHNLYVRARASAEEVALTGDGVAELPYATPIPSPLRAAGLPARDMVVAPAVLWAPDSRRLLTYRIALGTAGQYHLVQSVPLNGDQRPVLHSYPYPLPGDDEVPTAELLVIDVAERKSQVVQLEPVPLLHYGGPIRDGWTWWAPDSSKLYILSRSRGCQSLRLAEVDAASGTARARQEEHSQTAIDPHLTSSGKPNVRVFELGHKLLWFSQRDGWGHLYVYDLETGALIRQLTSGPWAVADVLSIDDAAGWVSFSAVGREAGLDPYFEVLYRVRLDGGEPERLTRENATHRVSYAPSGRVFVDSYSRIDQPPATVLRAADGTSLMELEHADIELLLQTGWTYPERFCVKARDRITEIHGVLIRPTGAHASERLPVLDDIYAGPQTNRAPASFAGYTSPSHQHPSHAARGFWHAQAIAELGFAVVMLDGMGMPYRAKAFHDRSFRNVGDGGIEDHVHALQQLGARYPELDLDRVGIYGHSAGGYASAHAMLMFPDFFKVAVSSAGNHDHRLDKAVWIERYMGLPLDQHYHDQANSTLAHQLKGKLLLIHGEMDENVHPASTLQFVDALIKANKDFELLILPNRSHACTDDPYFIRKRWGYFVRHLLGAEPPPDYRIAYPPGDGN